MARKNLCLLPLFILVITVGYTIYIVSTMDIALGNKHYFGFFFAGASVISIFVRRSLAIYFTGITLLAGTLNYIAFTPAIEAYSFGFGFSNMGTISIKIQLFSFLILLLYLILNWRFLLLQINKKVEINNEH